MSLPIAMASFKEFLVLWISILLIGNPNLSLFLKRKFNLQNSQVVPSPMGLLVLRAQESLSVRPWGTMQSWGVSTNQTVSLLLLASLGSGTSKGGLRMVRSSTGEVRVLGGDLSDALEDGVVARERFLEGINGNQTRKYSTAKCSMSVVS